MDDSSDKESSEWDHWDEQDAIFEREYFCYSLSSIDKTSWENGDKIIMPPSTLDTLLNLDIEYPMLFQLSIPYSERVTHCGVLEFTADDGSLYMPNWMMENMHIEEGDTVILRNASLKKGEFVKLQPHTKDFLEMSNPKAILETVLRSYSCFTTGDTVMIAYNNKKFYIDVVETRPFPAVSIIETDCEVDFAQPLDYEEPDKQLPSALSDRESPEVQDESTTKTAGIIPFTGLGRRLDDKSSTQSIEQPSSSMPKQQQAENETKCSSFKPSNTAPDRTSGRLVFGSKSNAPNIQTLPKASLKSTSQESSSQKEEEPKFQAFTGKKYTLRN